MQKLRQQQLFDRVFDRLPDHVTLLLIIISGFLLARLTWMMFPSDPSLIGSVSTQDSQLSQGVSVIKAHAKSADLGKQIASQHLLGVYKPPVQKNAVAPEPVKVVEAPKPKKPRPPLQLVGVYALSGKPGIAVINVKGKQEVIGVGEMIADSHGKLVKVSKESVEISWDGEITKLLMPNIDKTALSAMQLPASQQPQAAAPQQPALQPTSLSVPAVSQQVNNAVALSQPARPLNNAAGQIVANNNRVVGATANVRQPVQPAPTAVNNAQRVTNNQTNNAASGSASNSGGSNQSGPSLASFRQKIMNNNINLLKVIRPSPKRENGQLIGFRIRPGTNRALFQQTGLQSGDIVTHVNGMALNSNSASMQAMQSLTTSSSATLGVLRGGQATTVQVAF